MPDRKSAAAPIEDRPKRPSKRMIEFLRWLEGRGVVRQWPAEWGAIRRRATMDGMIESGGVDYSAIPFPVLVWRISDKGRETLASESARPENRAA